MKAKERRQLKQNDFAVTAMRVAAALTENRSRLTAVLVALVLVITTAGGYFWWRTRQANEAGALLGIAVATARAQIAPASTLPGAGQVQGTFPTPEARREAAIAAFTEVITRYESTSAAIEATYHRAGELRDDGQLADAERDYRAVMADADRTVYGPMATLGLAETLIAQGKTDEGLQVLADLAARRDGTLPTDALLVQLGRANLEAGRTAEARAAFRRVVDEFPESAYGPEARQQLTALN